jgi:hypothetical protein
MSRTLSQFRAAIGYPQQDNNAAEKFALAGGLAIEEVAAIGDPAKLIFCKNYEPNYSGGYRSKGGCEPVDGHRQPSAMVYQLVPVTVTNAANFPTTVGQQVNEPLSGPPIEIGPYFLGWETIGSQRYLVLTNTIKQLITASYDDGDEQYLDVTGITTGTVLYTSVGFTQNNFATASGQPTYLADVSKSAFYIDLARQVARTLIDPVGGSACTGPALGVFDFGGRLYAIRALLSGGAGLFHATGPRSVAVTPGWKQDALGSIVYYINNTDVALAVGATVVSGSSSFIARNIITMFGTVGGGDATGYIVTDAITGPAIGTTANLKVGGVTVATTPASGTVVRANTLPATGNYRFKRWNFTGVADNTRVYGVSGAGTAFEISMSGTTLVFTPIITGQGLTAATFNATPSADTPQVIETWQDQLFLFYRGGNMSHSGYQDPTNWTAVEGADQRYLGDDVTNAVGNINGAMIITTRNRMRVLYGDVNENFQLRDLNTEAGAYPFTAVPIGGLCMLTDEGVSFYDQTAQFGNFAGISLSQGINSLLKAYMTTGSGPIEAVIQRDHSFYRLYFDGGQFFTFCIVGKELRGIGRGEYTLGTSVYIALVGLMAFKVGDTLTNADGTASFIIRRECGLDSGAADGYLLTDVQLDPAAWPVGSTIKFLGSAFATVVSLTVNTAKNFWAVASTITNGGDNPPGERTYFCCDDGYVYEDDRGGSFGVLGSPVSFSLQTQFYYGDAVNTEKYYRRMYIDIIGADAFSNISLGAEFDDGYGYRAPEVLELSTRFLAASAFDQNSIYGVGFYGAAGKNVLRKELHGTGVGISVISSGQSTIAYPHTIQAVNIAYATRIRRGWR